MLIYNVDTFPYRGLMQSVGTIEKPKRARGKRYEKSIINAVCAFDIETSNIKTHTKRVNVSPLPELFLPTEIDTKYTQRYSIMYVWQFAFTPDFVCMGRTWDEFKIFISRLECYIKDKQELIIYVHNLSFEFQFLKGIFEFNSKDVFCIDSRKVLTARLHNKIEFRCSYILSNMSLKDFTKKMKVEHIKKDGSDIDYDKVRYSYSVLSQQNIDYCVNDVVGLVESVEVLMKSENDTLYTVPYTSTGYVRRDMKTAMKNLNFKYWQELQPDKDVYKMLRKAFRGGNTHANRWYVGEQDKTVKTIYTNYNVWTRDIASSYPAVMLNGLYPVKRFIEFMPTKDTFIKAKSKMKDGHKKYAILATIKYKNIRLRNSNWGAPYLAKDKCEVCMERISIIKKTKTGAKLKEQIVDRAAYDNGRIIEAKWVKTTVTDIDFDIIEKEYVYDDFEIESLYISEYGYLPECIKDVVRKYFQLKTEYKDAKKSEDEIFYTKAKNKLNACYGLFATNPVRATIELCNIYTDEDIVLDNDGKPCQTFRQEKLTEERIIEELEKIEKRPVFPYQWGVWVTALARLQLEKGIDLVYEHYDPCNCYFIYCDTDSVKYVDTYGVVNWDKFNDEVRAESLKHGGVAHKGKKEYILGIYELDDKVPCAKEFKTMGAKRYAYTDEKNHIHLTVAGVGKEKGAIELEEMGGLSAFVDGVIFTKAGGQIAYYTDKELPVKIGAFNDVLRITSNVYLEDTTKEISRTKEYIQLTDAEADRRKKAMNFVYAMCKEYVNRVDI